MKAADDWKPWPPPEGIQGCIEGRRADNGEVHALHVFHPNGESRWGYCVETYATHGRQTTVYPEFSEWRWSGAPTPTKEEQGNAILVWRFRDAPGELRAMSAHGGDEDWLGLFPTQGEWVGWAEDGTAFGCCDVQEIALGDGREVRIGAHA